MSDENCSKKNCNCRNTTYIGMDSLAIHGSKKHTNFNEHIFPIFQTSTFMFENVDQGARRFAGEEKGGIYTRLGNPNFEALAEKIADLEEGECGLVCSTGMSAISTVMVALLSKGDHLITDPILYGCTDSFFRDVLIRFGIEVSFIDLTDLKLLKETIKSNTKAIFFESIANPTMKVIDTKAVCDIAHNVDPEIKIIVDNTFATPIYHKPLKLGADVVIHSCTKYIGGHGDIVLGAAVFNETLKKQIVHVKNDLGTSPSPFDCWLAVKGIKTLPLRMRQHTENAKKVVEFLKEQKKISKVFYPGFSGMISFELTGGIIAGKTLLNNVKMIGLAVSLGNVDSLISHPASMTHAIVPKEQREKIGITDGLVRLSVGIENVEDIINDLDQALKKV